MQCIRHDLPNGLWPIDARPPAQAGIEHDRVEFRHIPEQSARERPDGHQVRQVDVLGDEGDAR